MRRFENPNLKELSKILISYPFSVFIGGFINLIMSYGVLDSFLKSYKEKLKLSTFSTRQANNLLFKKLIKHLSGNNQLVKNFCQYIREIIEYNAPNKEYKPNHFFIMGKNRQNQLAETYSRFKELSENEIKNKKDVKYISNKIKSLDEIFKTTDFTKFTLETEAKDIIKEIDEKYPINENFKKQFEEFESNVKHLNEMRKNFERKKESLIREIEYYCKNQKTLEFDYDVLLDNIQQICKKYIASHVVNDASKDVKYMMCQFYLKQIDLLFNSEIVRHRYSKLFESARISLWESIKTLDETSNARLFPKNIDEIKDKFETNKEKFKQSKNYSEFAEYCRECNPYTAFQGLRNRVNFPLKDHPLDEFVPNMREYKELKITDNDLEAISTKETGIPNQLSGHWFFQLSLFNKTNFNPDKIWIPLEFNKRSEIKFDKDLEIHFDSHGSFNIPKKYLQEIDQESLKEIRQSEFPFNIEAKG